MLQETHPSTAEGTESLHRFAAVNLASVWHRKWHVIFSVLITVSLGLVYVLVSPPTFESMTRVVIQQRGSSVDARQTARPNRAFLATQVEVMNSPIILRQAMKKVPLELPANSELDPVGYVLTKLQVNPMVQTDVVSVRFRSQTSDEAGRFVMAVIESYKDYLRDIENSVRTDTLAVLNRRESELRSELETFQDEYQELRKDSPLVGQGRDIFSVESSLLSDLGQRLSETRTRRFDVENKLYELALARGMRIAKSPPVKILPVGQRFNGNEQDPARPRRWEENELLALVTFQADDEFLNNPATASILRDGDNAATQDITQIQQQLWQTRVRTEELSENYGPKHSEILASQKQVAWWQKILREQMAVNAVLLVHKLEVARSTESRLEQLYSAQRTRVKRMDEHLLRETSLQSKIARVEDLYQETMTLLTDQQLADQAMQRGQVSVVVRALDGPNLTETIIWPSPKKLLALCGVLGLMGGLLLVFRGEYVKPTCKQTPPSATPTP